MIHILRRSLFTFDIKIFKISSETCRDRSVANISLFFFVFSSVGPITSRIRDSYLESYSYLIVIPFLGLFCPIAIVTAPRTRSLATTFQLSFIFCRTLFSINTPVNTPLEPSEYDLRISHPLFWTGNLC